MTDEAWGCLFMICVTAVTSVVFYGITYFLIGFLDISNLSRTALSLLIGISGALGAQQFVATGEKK